MKQFTRRCWIEMEKDYEFSKKVIDISLKIYKRDYSSISNNWRHLALDVLSIKKANERLDFFEKELETDFSDAKVLEVGSGLGVFVGLLRKKEIDCWGVEPDLLSHKGSGEVLKEMGIDGEFIKKGFGEKLPFKDDKFDVVLSHSVLEHVEVPQKVVDEAIRVLRPGGRLCFVAPNYNSFWEPHYGLYWFPRLPKYLAKYYVKVFNKNPDFLDDLNFTTPSFIRKLFSKDSVSIEKMGKDVWAKRMKGLNFTAWGQSSKIKKISELVSKVGLTDLVIKLGQQFEFYYPLVIVVRKKEG